MAIILSSFKVAGPDIAVDTNQSERIDCANCYLLFKGKLLEPPFYLTRREGILYVNGYQFVPFVAPAFGDKGAAKSVAPLKNKGKAFPDQGNTVCMESINIAGKNARDSFIYKTKNKKRRYIQREFEKNYIKLIALSYDEGGASVRVEYLGTTCQETVAFGIASRLDGIPAENQKRNPERETPPTPIDSCYARLQSGLRDGTIFFPLMHASTYCNSSNSYSVDGDFLLRLEAIISGSIDPRIKLHRLRLLTDSLGSRYLLANSQR